LGLDREPAGGSYIQIPTRALGARVGAAGSMTRKRKIATAVLTTLLICAVAAVAYWALLSSGSGSSPPTTLGKAAAPASYSYSYTISPSFPPCG
jgi:hypothetical protein